MTNTPEDFEKLQKLLKVKRYEVPPPGYFNNFSTRVINGIERNENSGHAFAQAPWLRRLFSLLETNPFVAGIFGVSTCGLLISMISWSLYQPATEFAGNSGLTMTVADNTTAIAPASMLASASVDSLSPSLNSSLGTNISGALFSGMERMSAQPVNFTVSH